MFHIGYLMVCMQAVGIGLAGARARKSVSSATGSEEPKKEKAEAPERLFPQRGLIKRFVMQGGTIRETTKKDRLSTTKWEQLLMVVLWPGMLTNPPCPHPSPPIFAIVVMLRCSVVRGVLILRAWLAIICRSQPHPCLQGP